MSRKLEPRQVKSAYMLAPGSSGIDIAQGLNAP